MPTTLTRRDLQFTNLDQIPAEAERLRAGGYDRAGAWDLSQCCGHLSDWLTYPIDGNPPLPAPVRLAMAVVRTTIGPRMLRRILETGTLPAGKPTLPSTVPISGGDAAAAVARLRRAVERFRAHRGPLHPSPLFGTMDHATASRLQLLHAALHLSFLIPRSPATSQD